MIYKELRFTQDCFTNKKGNKWRATRCRNTALRTFTLQSPYHGGHIDCKGRVQFRLEHLHRSSVSRGRCLGVQLCHRVTRRHINGDLVPQVNSPDWRWVLALPTGAGSWRSFVPSATSRRGLVRERLGANNHGAWASGRRELQGLGAGNSTRPTEKKHPV